MYECATSFTEVGLQEMLHALNWINWDLQLPVDVHLNYTTLVKYTTSDDWYDGWSRKKYFSCARQILEKNV